MKDSESLFIITYITWMRSKARVLRPSSSGNPSSLSLKEMHPKDNAIEQGQELGREELERQELER